MTIYNLFSILSCCIFFSTTSLAVEQRRPTNIKYRGHYKRFDTSTNNKDNDDTLIELYDNGPKIRCKLKNLRRKGSKFNSRYCQSGYTSVTMVDADCPTTSTNSYYYDDWNYDSDSIKRRRRKKCFAASIVMGDSLYHINSNGMVTETNSSDYPDEDDPMLIDDDEEEEEDKQYPPLVSSTRMIIGNSTMDSINLNNLQEMNNLQAATDSSTKTIIDILVVATKGAKDDAEYYKYGPIEDLVNLAVAETNQAFDNSGINVEINLAKLHIDDSGYTNDLNDSLSSTLYHLTYTQGHSKDIDGQLDYIHQMRKDVGADMVQLITTGQGCGVAWASGNNINANRMFSVSKYTCAVGYNTFAHELGHNIGALHDKGTSNKCGSADYRYGYRDPNGQFRSILSYSCKKNQCDDYDSNGPCTRLPFFSNPNLKWNGQPMGYDAGSIIGETNNARRINERAEYVAGLYTRPEEPEIPEITTSGPTTKPSSAPSKSTNTPTPRPTRRRRRPKAGKARRKRTRSPNMLDAASFRTASPSSIPTRNSAIDLISSKRVREHISS